MEKERNENEELNLEVESVNEITATTIEELREKLSERLNEILVTIDEFEVGNIDLTESEYNSLIAEKKEISKDLKKIKPTEKKTFWEKISVWILVYSIIEFIVCLPFLGLQFNLTIVFNNYIKNLLQTSLAGTGQLGYVINVALIFIFPIINIVSGAILEMFVCQTKDKANKIYFSVTYGLMVLFTIISFLTILL